MASVAITNGAAINGVTTAPSSQAATATVSQPSQPPSHSAHAATPALPPPPPPPSQQQQQQQQAQLPPTGAPHTLHALKPRDVRTMELLLTAQGVTAYETRVPQLLLDFAYRHTSAILSDALHLSADPYTTHAGARPSASSGATASVPPSADATVSANAIQLAIASRLAFQFRGGAGGPSAGGGPSKEWLLELARERNRVALPRVGAVEWGARLPSERFVLSGVGWGLRDAWAAGAPDDDDDDEDDDGNKAREDGDGGADAADEDLLHLGHHTADAASHQTNGNRDVAMADAPDDEDVSGDGVEGGTIGDVFADDDMEDEMME